MSGLRQPSPDTHEDCGCGCESHAASDAHCCRAAADAARPVALVTGGAVRIGAAICRTLCYAGYDLIIHCRHSVDAAKRLQAEFAGMGAGCEVLVADLLDERQLAALLEQAWQFASRLDLLVNNASIFTRETLADATPAVFEAHWRMNTLAPMLLTRLYARRVTAAGQSNGCVVNLLDRRVATHEGGSLAYLTSKKALMAFTLGAALELAPAIRVNGVGPGAVLPPPGGLISERAGRAPLNVSPRPEDVARAVLYLAQSDCVTGEILYVDAGQHLVSVQT